MMQTLAAVCITWGFFHASLHPHQVIAAIILIAAVAMAPCATTGPAAQLIATMSEFLLSSKNK